MKGRRAAILLALTAACGALAFALGGCRHQGVLPDETPPRDILGDYQSTEPVGPMGLIRLRIEWNQPAHRYKAVLSSLDSVDFGENTGYGTYGGTHLVLNFFAARNDLDFFYYFLQGQVTPESGPVETISGTFVFPDQKEELAVTFIPR